MVTTTSTTPLIFKAVWTHENRHLEETFIETVTKYVLYFINRLATATILPSTLRSRHIVDSMYQDFERNWIESPLMQKNFSKRPIEVTTPDNTLIKGTFFKSAAATESSPTVIFFQPNATHSQQNVFEWVLHEAGLREVPYNFIYFDYRGCDTLNNRPDSAKNLYLDGESIYQFVRDQLHVPSKDIHFYGFSLGGGIGVNVKKLHQEEATGRSVIERSYSTINDVVANIIYKRFTGCVASVFTQIATFYVSLLNWNIDSASALENLKGKLLIIHHPQDEMMHGRASLYRHVFERGVAPSSDVKHIDLSRSGLQNVFYHATPLPQFSHRTFKPVEEVCKFLFSTNLSTEERLIQIYRNSTSQEFRNKVHTRVAELYQNGGYYWGSGEDACNRRNGQSLTDHQLARAIAWTKAY